jgi:hypothetical protein
MKEINEMSNENVIGCLLQDWEKAKLSAPEERKHNFEQKRLETIEKLARAFVDYYNANVHSKPHTLEVTVR